MRFAHPNVLWLLLLLPPLALYGWTWRFRSLARLRYSSFRLLPQQRANHRPRSLLVLAGIRLAVLTLVILALARPQRGQSREESVLPATDIMICLDTSGSMEALDFKPKNRLDAAKGVIAEFINNRAFDRLGLVVFSGLAFTQCPLTTDHGALLTFLDQVRIGMIKSDGTAIGTGIATSAARLKNSEAKSKVIVLLTDGRNNAGEVDPVTAARAAAALGIRIYAVGAGRPGSSLFPVKDPVLGTRYVQLPEDLDEGTLRQVAEATDGRYFRATDTETLREVYREIDRLEKTDVRVERFGDFEDFYFPFLLAALVLLSTEMLLGQTAFRRFP